MSHSGTLRLRVKIEGDRATETSFINVPAFAPILGARVNVPEIGTIEMDIAFGGNFFAIVSAEAVRIEIASNEASRIAALGLRIRDAANQQLRIEHPVLRHLNRVSIVSFQAAPRHRQARYLNTHVFADGAVDRSPGGTGTSAALAVLRARGKLSPGEEIVVEGLTGGLFRGKLLDDLTEGSVPAVKTEITGSAFVTGYHQFVLDPQDPSNEGFEMQ